MSITFYNYVLSGNCYKFRLLASILDVEYDTIAVDFHPGQAHKSESLLKLNPAGTLPILTIDDLVLTESQAMLVWLANHHDESGTWWPINEGEHSAQLLQWLGFSSRLTASVGELRLHSMLNKAIDVQLTTKFAIRTLRELENHLTEQNIKELNFIVGNNPTVADIACFPYTALCPDAGIEHDDYPAIRQWLHRIRSLDGFITMPGIHELHERNE